MIYSYLLIIDISLLSSENRLWRIIRIIRGTRSISTEPIIQRMSFCLLVTAFVLYYNSLHRLLPTCCHFETKRNSRLIGSCQGYTSHVISFIIGVSVDATGREESIGALRIDVCIARFFGPVLHVRRTTAFQRRHFVAFRDTAHTFSEVNTRGECEWITRTRTPNCRKFSANFTDDAHELPSVPNYARARKFDCRSLLFASYIHTWYMYVRNISIDLSCRSVLHLIHSMQNCNS